MKTINRFALIVRPADPYVEWAATAFGEPVSKVRKELDTFEPSVYLLPESTAPDVNHPTVLKSHWRSIFKEELDGWCTDESTWPKQLSEALFRAWFKLELCTVVYDRTKTPIKHEE